jgi:anti-sigma factor RsiW
MNCSYTSEAVYAYLDGELDANGRMEVLRHLDTCDSCRSAYEQARELRRAIKDSTPYFSCPADAAERIRSAARREAKAPGRWFSTPWVWGAVAASLLLAVSLAYNVVLLNRRVPQQDLLAQEVLSSHIRSLLGSHLMDVPSSDQHTVKPWFNGKLDFSPPVKDLSAQGFALAGGRVDFVDNRPVAALIFRRRQHIINVFVWPDSGGSRPLASKSMRNGYNLLHWTDAGFAYWAASDLNSSELRQFADLLRQR